MGGGKRKSFNKSRNRRPNQSLFIEGGILAGFDTPSASNRGKNRSNSSNGRSGLKFRDSGSGSNSNSKPASRKSAAMPDNAFRYDYPSVDSQVVVQSESCNGENKSDGIVNGSQPLILLCNKDSEIVVYEDPGPSMEASEVAYEYEYSSDFVLGESSHTGLGFSEGPDTTPGITELSSGVVDEEEECHRGLGFSDKPEAEASGIVFSSTIVYDEQDPSCYSSAYGTEGDAVEGSMDEDDSEAVRDPEKTPSSGKNSAFVSIGGVRVYTEDISDSESEEEHVSSEEGSSSEASESDDSEDSSDFDSDSDVDEDVMQDYLEGIGGSSQLLDSKWLATQDIGRHQELDDSDDDSSDRYGDTLKKLSGFALQEASKQYGMEKRKPKKKPSAESHKHKSKAAIDWSPVDDMMLVKDPRRLCAKKKHVAKFPQSWPSDTHRSKRSARFPGEKKKIRKEMIVEKRRARMLRRGVDLEQINLKLKQMVLNNADVLAFHPMHPRDCSQVQRLAAIYSLKSGCQGSGKKRFVTVSRTQYTFMPSASDEIRVEKLIGSSKDEADYPVVDTPIKIGKGSSKGKSAKNSANRQRRSGKSEKSSGKKPAAYATQPVSFVSSGTIQSETVQVKAGETGEPSNKESKPIASTSTAFGSFEVHTKGFGSKMMAKMGYVEGEGLGKDGKGMSKPIEVIQRPKSLGLGMNFEEDSSSEPAKVVVAKQSIGSARRPKGSNPNIGAFEKHTKGFGSKMMVKMGFVEGTGLGRDSQGIVTPLAAVRRPKARGLGAEDKRA